MGQSHRTKRVVERRCDVPRDRGRAGSALAQALAPEDVRRGDYLAVLHTIAELPSFY